MKPRGIKIGGSRKRIVSRIGIAHDADSQHAAPEMIPFQQRLLDPGGAEPAAKSGGRERRAFLLWNQTVAEIITWDSTTDWNSTFPRVNKETRKHG